MTGSANQHTTKLKRKKAAEEDDEIQLVQEQYKGEPRAPATMYASSDSIKLSLAMQ